MLAGCGNSSLSDDMYKDGYTNITNMDYSPVVIRNMEEKYPHMKWDVMDVMSMTYSSGDFDVILEKGTIDALLVGEKDPWRMSDESQELMDTILSQVQRFTLDFLFCDCLPLCLFEIRNCIFPTGSTPKGGPTEISPTTQATRHPRGLVSLSVPSPPVLLSCILHQVRTLPCPPVLYI